MLFSSLISTFLLIAVALTEADARLDVASIVSVPLCKVQPPNDLHPLIIHQLHVNAAYVRLAKMTGSTLPTAFELAANLQNRLLALSSMTQIKKRAEGGYNPTGVEAKNNNAMTPANTPSDQKSVGLNIIANNLGYTGIMQIGTPPRDFNMLIDSGSSDFFVASDNCQSDSGGPCSVKHVSLGPSTSSTFNDTEQPWSIRYFTGTVSGTKVTDNVKFASLSLTDLLFGVAHNETSELAGDDVLFDGILGLGQASLSSQGTPSFLSMLKNAFQIQSRVAGFKIPRLSDEKHDGELTLGGVDMSKFDTSSVVTLDNIGDRYWHAKVDYTAMDGTTIGLGGGNSRTVIFDTGTTLIIAPPADTTAIHDTIPGSKYDNSTQSWTIPCTTTSVFSMTFGGRQFTVDPRDLLFLPVDANNLTGDCISGISPGYIGGSYVWLLGDVFLRNVYMSVDEDQNKVSLAKLV